MQDPRTTSRLRPAFTLVEMAVSMVVLSILVLAAGSAMSLCLRSIPDRRSTPSMRLAAGLAMETMKADLFCAIAVGRSLPTEWELTLQDRDGNGVLDKVRYSWSGTPGGPLVREYAVGDPSSGGHVFGGATTLCEDVRDFALVAETRQEALPPKSVEGAEVLLDSHDAALNLKDFQITSTGCCAQYFLPVLPADATAWRVTRIAIRTRVDGWANGRSLIQLRTARAGVPTQTVLAQALMYESGLQLGNSWQLFNFGTTPPLSPSVGACVVIQCEYLSPSAAIQYRDANATSATGHFAGSNNGGSSWTITPSADLLYYVYGTISTPEAAGYRTRIVSAHARLRTGGDPEGLTTCIRLPNEPEVGQP